MYTTNIELVLYIFVSETIWMTFNLQVGTSHEVLVIKFYQNLTNGFRVITNNGYLIYFG